MKNEENKKKESSGRLNAMGLFLSFFFCWSQEEEEEGAKVRDWPSVHSQWESR